MDHAVSPERVGIFCDPSVTYPDSSDFSPSDAFPEYPFGALLSARPNLVYPAVREAFLILGLDRENAGATQWNPLKDLVKPGDRVVLKPNLVLHDNEAHPGNWQSVITHGSVIRAVLDYVHIALRGRGQIVIADAPHHDCDFALIREHIHADGIEDFYGRHASIPVQIRDLRQEFVQCANGVSIKNRSLPGDPEGYAALDLGCKSTLSDLGSTLSRLFGSEYDRSEIREHHNATRHEYCLSKTVLGADVVIGIPKLKTHKKVGLTVNLKNLVGINGNKNWLPHFRVGAPQYGGDEFPSEVWGTRKLVETLLKAQLYRFQSSLTPSMRRAIAYSKPVLARLLGDSNDGHTIRGGDWPGNDTCWRTCLDLNRILLYAQCDPPEMLDVPVRRFYSVVDGIIAGEGSGPMSPDPKPCGLIVAGSNAVWTDTVCAHLMGFDWAKVPLIRESMKLQTWPLHGGLSIQEVRCLSNVPDLTGPLDAIATDRFRFRPHHAWVGRMRK